MKSDVDTTRLAVTTVSNTSIPLRHTKEEEEEKKKKEKRRGERVQISIKEVSEREGRRGHTGKEAKADPPVFSANSSRRSLRFCGSFQNTSDTDQSEP